MNRRGFLGGLGLILAAPAVVRAESLMKIWAPPGRIWMPYSRPKAIEGGWPDGEDIYSGSGRALYVGTGFEGKQNWFPSMKDALPSFRPGDTVYIHGVTAKPSELWAIREAHSTEFKNCRLDLDP